MIFLQIDYILDFKFRKVCYTEMLLRTNWEKNFVCFNSFWDSKPSLRYTPAQPQLIDTLNNKPAK